MAGAVPHDETHDGEPISPELAMIDPELARRHALTQPVWETVQARQAAARVASEVDDRTSGASRARRRRWLLLAAAATTACAGALVLFTVGVVSRAPRLAATPTAPIKPPVGHASAKPVRRHARVPSAPVRPRAAKARVPRPAVVAPPVTAKTAPPAAPTETSWGSAKPRLQQPQRHAAKRRVPRPAVAALPVTAKTAVPGAPTETSRASTKPRLQQPQPQRHAAKRRVTRPAVAAPPVTAKKAARAAPTESPPGSAKTRTWPLVGAGAAAAARVMRFTPGPKTFVWTNVSGATEYHVDVFKGSRAILVRRTRTARLTVPGSWRYAGSVETLAPGRYHWYIWFARGRQSTGTVVSSTILIKR